MSQDIVTFGVIGLGYVGLPLSVEAGRSGLKVIGFDINTAVVTGVNAGRSHIQDLTDADVASLLDQGLLEATTDMRRLAECDAVSICVPTPLSKTRDPDVSYVIAASEAGIESRSIATIAYSESDINSRPRYTVSKLCADISTIMPIVANRPRI